MQIFLVLHLLSDRDRVPLEDSKMDGEGMAAKRRHSRPLELDSEGEEEESLSDREEEPDETEAVLLGKVSRFSCCH